ncbi:hypothetical protein OHC33_000893 [Knufia fluminis]|uniref:HAUS augmin-like complex subunit 1 n=1 Tax=Knufia fluminis TaxID=191047 RepID=A0AAN8EK82_9EURO|nr:hypothetical protein OHC33_000893 [Knufia fluminis]
MPSSPTKPPRPLAARTTSYPTTPSRPPTFSLPTTSPDHEPIISPTKAAAQTRLNHDLTTLTTWLETLFQPHPIPVHLLRWRDEASALSTTANGYGFDDVISKNDFGPSTPNETRIASSTSRGTNDILESLKALKQVNLLADHFRSLLHEASLEELRYLETLQVHAQHQRDEKLPAKTLLDDLHAHLPRGGQGALESLSESAVMLGLQLRPVDGDNNDSSHAADLYNLIARRVLEQASRKLVIEEQVRELELLQKTMTARSTSIDSKHEVIKGNDGIDLYDEQAEKIHAQTVQFNRDVKQINLKIMEYEDRVKGLERQLAGLRTESADLQNVLEARRRVEQRKASVAALQQRVAAFHGLPPDLEASRNEVRRAISELDVLKQRREGLFEKMGNG